MSQRIRDHVNRMTKEEKVAEFKLYLHCSGLLYLDVDQIMADGAAMGAPESVLDSALLRCATLAGTTLGRRPLTAQELAAALKGEDQNICEWLRQRSGRGQEVPGVSSAEVPVSLRRSARSNK